MNLRGLRIVVAGMGKSGAAALELLSTQGALLRATDNRPLAELGDAARVIEKLGVGFVPQSPKAFEGIDLMVVSPGVPLDLPEIAAALARGVKLTGELELAAPFLKGPKIGITGSNGKTTTTALTAHILKECGIPCQVGGNIGWPPAAMVASSKPGQWNVLELSSFQLETIHDFRADIAVCLNVTPDHLDRHKTFEAYTAAKRRLFETQRSGDWAVLNADDPVTHGWANRISAQPVWFSQLKRVSRGLWVSEGGVHADGELMIPFESIQLRGRHNLENVMAAAAAAQLAGAPKAGIRAAVASFQAVEHRLEFVRRLRGVDYFNDSKATNVDAALKAIEAFPGGLWIILGGKDKGGDYTPLAAALRGKARGVMLIGAAAEKIAGQLGGLPLAECGTLDAAVRKAAAAAEEGDTVLLAPACASFDQFRNYEERGRLFKTLVTGIV